MKQNITKQNKMNFLPHPAFEFQIFKSSKQLAKADDRL